MLSSLFSGFWQLYTLHAHDKHTSCVCMDFGCGNKSNLRYVSEVPRHLIYLLLISVFFPLLLTLMQPLLYYVTAIKRHEIQCTQLVCLNIFQLNFCHHRLCIVQLLLRKISNLSRKYSNIISLHASISYFHNYQPWSILFHIHPYTLSPSTVLF